MSYQTKQTTESEDRGVAAGANGKGRAMVAVAINHFEDSHHGSSLPAMATVDAVVSDGVVSSYSFAGVAGTYLAGLMGGSATQETMRASWLLRFTTVASTSTLKIHVLDSTYTSVYSAFVLGDFAVTSGYFWFTAFVNAGLVGTGTYYLAIEVPSGTAVSVPYYTSTGNNIVSAVGGTPTTVVSNARPIFITAEIYGKTAPLERLDSVEVDVMTLGVKA